MKNLNGRLEDLESALAQQQAKIEAKKRHALEKLTHLYYLGREGGFETLTPGRFVSRDLGRLMAFLRDKVTNESDRRIIEIVDSVYHRFLTSEGE